MINSEIKRQKKLKKLLDITSIDEKQLAKLNQKVSYAMLHLFQKIKMEKD